MSCAVEKRCLELMELKHRIIIVFKDSHFVTQKLHVPYGADVKACDSKNSELHSTSSIFLASSVQSACTLRPVLGGRPTSAEMARHGRYDREPVAFASRPHSPPLKRAIIMLLSSHLLGLLSGRFLTGFLTKILCTLISSPPPHSTTHR